MCFIRSVKKDIKKIVMENDHLLYNFQNQSNVLPINILFRDSFFDTS